MRRSHRRRNWLIAVGVVAACVIAVIAARNAIVAALLPHVTASATGMKISAGSVNIGLGSATLKNVVVRSRAGEPIADIARIHATYDLRDLVTGKKRRYGLRTLEIIRPQITLIRHRDGTWNIPLPKPAKPGKPGAPIDVSGKLVDGSVVAIGQMPNFGPPLRVTGVHATFAIDTAGASHYDAGLIYHENGRSYAISGTGKLNAKAGFGLQHWTVPAMPVARLIDFAAANPDFELASGSISGADVRIFSIPDASGALQTGVIASTLVRNVDITSNALRKPVRDVHGRLDVSAQGAILEGVSGTLAGVPITASGGVYDLAHPALRFGIALAGNLAVLRGAIAQAARLPISGDVDLHILAEGALTAPLVTIAIRSSQIRYLSAPVRDAAGLVAYSGNELDIISARAAYAGFTAGARGRVALASRKNAIEILARAAAAPDTVPYAADVVPGMPIDGTLLATARNPKLIDTRGVIDGRSASQRLAAAFAVTSRGAGSVGPLVVSGSRGRLFLQIALDHPSGDHAAYLDVRGLDIAAVTVPPLPGFPVHALPPLSGVFDAQILGTLDRGRAAAAGTGRLRGSLAPLNAFLPAARARGSIDAPIALLYGSNQAIVQVDGARFHDASVSGVAVQRASATVAMAPHALRVLSLDARVANGEALASGSLGNGDRIALSAENIPLLGGSVSAAALARADLRAPSLASTVLARNMRYDRVPISGMTSLDYARGTLGIADATVGAGPAYLSITGSVGGLALGKPILPRYDLTARLRAADAQSLAAIAAPSRARLVTGSIDGDVHIGGSGKSPRVRGSLKIPEGSVNGLAFRDLHAALSGNARAISMTGGSVTIGTTAIAFHGNATLTRHVDVAVEAPHADLADFDDFFNAGDMLGGTGNFSAALAYAPGSIASTGSAAFRNMRYSRLNIDNAEAGWSTTGKTIAVAVLAGGSTGTFQTSGTIDSSSRAMNLAMTLTSLDLSTWLPEFGFTEPVSGLLDASGTVSGVFPNVDSSLQAHVVNGIAGPFTVQRAAVALHTSGGFGRIDSAEFEVPDLVASASGTFGFHAGDPLAITARATTPDIGLLEREATGKPNDLAGALSTTLDVTGTRLAPQIADQSTLTGLRYGKLTIPRVTAQATVTQHWLAIDRAEADLQHGRVTLAAQVPIRLSPPGIPRNAPFTASITAGGLDLTDFTALMPSGTKLSGLVNGTVHAAGEIGDPQLNGLLALTGASYSGPQESTPITGGAQLAFAGQHVALQHAAFSAGGGRLTMTANATVPSVHDVNGITLAMSATAANVDLDLPKYYNGHLNGTLTATRAAGQALTLGGTVTLSSARVPLSAFTIASSSKGGPALPFNVAFDNFTIAVGSDVRVQSPNVDVGAQGHLTLNGTLAKLAPSGSFLSTGGTISFYRTFTIQRASVDFSPSSGIIPDVDAVATTFITDPDTQIRLQVTGPATSLNLALSSHPAYNRSQILGLLVGAQQFGAVQGVASTGTGSFSATSAVTTLAAGQLNTVFSRSLLEPVNTALASTLGFNNVQLTSNIAQGQYGAQFVKAFGRDLRAIFNETVGYPERTSLTLEATPNAQSAIRLTGYTQPDLTAFPLSQPPGIPPPGTAGQAALEQMQMLSGTNGFNLSYVRRYW